MSTVEIRTLGPAVARFFETYLVHPKGHLYGQPFALEPWQRAFIDELYRVDALGRRIYRQALLGIPRGNGKTPLAAGLGLFELMTRPDAPDIFNAAGSKDQARFLTDFATSFARGKLRNWLTAHRRAITHRESLGVMRLVSSEGHLQHGGSVSAAIADELWAWRTDAQEEVYDAFWSAMHKREDALLLAITTAGFDLASLLGRQYAEAWRTLELEERELVAGVGPCLRIGRDEENGILVWWYGPPDELEVDDLIANEAIWRAVNPATWIPIVTLRKQLAGLGFDVYEFCRLHLNAWTRTRDVFIPAAAWRACRSERKMRRRVPTYVAVDVGMTHDTTAVAWSQPDPDFEPQDSLARLEPRKTPAVLSRVRVWSSNPDHARDKTQRHIFVPGGRMDLELVEEFILALHRNYEIRELVYDMYAFEGEAQRLAKRGIPTAPLYQHGVHPQIAAQRLFQDVKQGKALHAGDRVLERHVLAAAGVKTERGWKISRLQSGAPIDAAVALAMAHWRASRYRGSVYDERDPIVLGDDEDDDE
ncbi:MAG: terminase large subunit domain-containing protein [Candidatus Rokuibacteriota bacterium]